ncbi:hypothetical protein AC1031_020992 [Aphanomyces cochlioides]|nr:hypothetical protein AC1031_020992 [Aphanomyces cochlioides]
MAQVRPSNTTHVAVNRLSILFNVFYVLKILSAPFLAYLTEPFPWSASQAAIDKWDDFEYFNNETYALLTKLYNDETFKSHEICMKDSRTSSYAIRYSAVIPPVISAAGVLHYLVRFPGAIFYGHGIVEFITSFLAQTLDERNSSTQFQCQHIRYFGFPLNDICLWFEPHLEEQQASASYMIYLGVLLWESTAWTWFKLLYRCALVLYIARALQRQYYNHFKSLIANLGKFGVDRKEVYTRFEIVLDDPTCLILQDPIVSFVMVVDIWIGVSYIGQSIMRVSQFQDIGALTIGFLYTSRFVMIFPISTR